VPNQSWESVINNGANIISSGSALASSTTLTDISPTPNLTLPANFLQVGSGLRLTAAGFFSNTSTPTLLLGFYYGGVAGTALAATGATTTTTGATSWPWILEWEGVVRTVGSSGTIMGNGKLFLGTSLTVFAPIPIPATAIATVTIDTTTAKAITVGAQWGTNSASNTTTCTKLIVESIA
jgi:hypothetical protein